MSHKKIKCDTAHQVSLVALNQIGFETNRSKRFTAPFSSDGSVFEITKKNKNKVLYKGVIQNKIGDFSNFKPTKVNQEYAIHISDSKLSNGRSDPFLIEPDLYRKRLWQPAVDFLIDSRSIVGTHPSAYGGAPWRDGTYYDFIIPSLVLLYLSNPDAIQFMPKQINWQEDAKKVLSANFKYVHERNASNFFEITKRYYQDIPAPKINAPDIVKLIHWGVGIIVLKPKQRDPSGDPLGNKIHSQSLEQVIYALWAWEHFKDWLPKQLYQQALKLVFSQWKRSGGMDIDPLWKPNTYGKQDGLIGKRKWLHPIKGRHPPGHSIVPNLMMHEIAIRENKDNPEQYLIAAIQQAKFIIENIDWNNPYTTRGHRMSEARTMTNLVWFLQHYPRFAPKSLKKKIEQWAQVTIKRSNNLWDYRKFSDTEWSVPQKNDVGNLIGFPAPALAASWVISDQKTTNRIKQIAIAQVDNVFGRNPHLAAAPAHPRKVFPDIERGWPVHYRKDVCARLELCRGSISSSPGSEMYPFNPGIKYRHPEGWVNYGAALCTTLAYLELDRKKSFRNSFKNKTFTKQGE